MTRYQEMQCQLDTISVFARRHDNDNLTNGLRTGSETRALEGANVVPATCKLE